ncbi:hypothetical protein EDC01DRAFT_619521 [Geopyxis carbonaria]|nr:hypothetical protein EDC01DRAFT_619521 [Geopyxis carbonaria]
MWAYVIRELRLLASDEIIGPGAVATNHSAWGLVIKSDRAVSHRLQHELQAAVAALQADQAPAPDWQPGSQRSVLNLVDPSLYPLVYGRSRVLADGRKLGIGEECVQAAGAGCVAPAPRRPASEGQGIGDEISGGYSWKFQWLPCEVRFHEGQARIESYINNLHPQRYRPLYRLIEELIDAAIPMWNITLPARGWDRDVHNSDDATILYREKHFDKDPAAAEASIRARFASRTTDLRREFDRLQVVVRITSTVLNPANNTGQDQDQDQDEEGGQDQDEQGGQEGREFIYKHRQDAGWSVAGWMVSLPRPVPADTPRDGQNEHICASANYYLSDENVTTGELNFSHEGLLNRRLVCMKPSLYYYEWGMEEWSDGGQTLAPALSVPGRLVTFPNNMRHYAGPFQLCDKTRPGHRTVVQLHLVDPTRPVLSTANVPPQQRDWWAPPARDACEAALHRLPAELRNMCWPYGPEAREELADTAAEHATIGRAEAEALRNELIRDWETRMGEYEAWREALCVLSEDGFHDPVDYETDDYEQSEG